MGSGALGLGSGRGFGDGVWGGRGVGVQGKFSFVVGVLIHWGAAYLLEKNF